MRYFELQNQIFNVLVCSDSYAEFVDTMNMLASDITNEHNDGYINDDEHRTLAAISLVLRLGVERAQQLPDIGILKPLFRQDYELH